MAMLSGHWMLRGYGMWAVEVKESGVLAGYVGPFYPESWPDQEIGWTIAKPMWGHGYATEAAQAALTYARDTLKWPRVIHLIDPENVKSIAVAKRLGSQQDGEWVRNDKPLHIYAQSLNAK
jgi:ribosomal-protein-alanine N-acetyltransferase